MDTGLCPNEAWSQTRVAHEDFCHAHVFGCPVYVLEPKLQDNQVIPKWHPCTRLGMFLGFSTVHSSLVPLVLNTRTGRISPQYHVIFDDKFETVKSLPTATSPDTIWLNILQLHRDFFLDKENDAQGNLKLSHLPDLDKDWLPEDSTTSEESMPT